MEEQFVPYELSVKLKELGFDEECFKVYDELGFIQDEKEMDELNLIKLNAPLWQQAFDWFRKKYKLDGYVFSNSSDRYTLVVKNLFSRNTLIETPFNFKDTYEEARQACLEKLIEICAKK